MIAHFRILASTGLHKGDRDYQQDQVALIKHPRAHGCLLALVADGMGGRSGGRKASDQVLLTAQQLFERYNPKADDAQELLKQWVHEAHLVIKLTAVSSEQEPHSTVAGFLINPDASCHWIHAGDSRVYHFRDNEVMHRTLDHSYVQTLVDTGQLTEEQAQVHPQSNILIGCLGTDEDPPTPTYSIDHLRPGDVLMACSDGLWHYFDPHELAYCACTMPPLTATQHLVDVARERGQGTGDNISIVIVKIEAHPPAVRKPKNHIG